MVRKLVHHFSYGIDLLPRFSPFLCIFPFLRHILNDELISCCSAHLAIERTMPVGILSLIAHAPFLHSPVSRVFDIPYTYNIRIACERGRPPPMLAPRIMTTFLLLRQPPNIENPHKYQSRSANATTRIRRKEYLAKDRGELIGGVMYPIFLSVRLLCR